MKKQPKVTPWFPGDVKPVHVGVYQRMLPYGCITHYHFDGANWLYGGHSDPERAIAANVRSPDQDLQWRGLTKAAA